MRVVNRHEWNMPPIAENHTGRDLTSITEANVHHSDTTPPHDHADCADTVRSIDSYHRSKGWACIGYNRVICPHGYVFVGRPLDVEPAAAENHNSHIIAYCILAKGNDPADHAAQDALRDIIRHDRNRLNKILKLTTHREVEPSGYTECPGDGIEQQIKHWRNTTYTRDMK